MTRRLAYLCLQATTEGQASHAHVNEIIAGLREGGWDVDLYEPSYAGSTAPGAWGRLREFHRVQRRLVAHLSEYDALYVRAHPLAALASRAARASHLPVIQECNGAYQDVFLAWPATRRIAPLIKYLARSQYRHADALIAVTAQIAAWLKTQVSDTDVAVIPNGANTDLFSPAAQRPDGLPDRYVVFFGALAPWQGIGTCLEATERAEWPQGVSLVVVGDGMLRADVESAATSNPARITYVGSVPYREVAGIVANSVASLVPMHLPSHSRPAPSPLKLYESLACGVPVIASDIPGVPEIVHTHRCGLIFPSGDAVALATAARDLAEAPAQAAEMGARGHAYVVAEASWRARARATSDVIARAISS